MVNGVNYPNTSENLRPETAEGGWGRVTISPKKKSQQDKFEIRMEIH